MMACHSKEWQQAKQNNILLCHPGANQLLQLTFPYNKLRNVDADPIYLDKDIKCCDDARTPIDVNHTTDEPLSKNQITIRTEAEIDI